MSDHISDLLAILGIQRDGYTALVEYAHKLNGAILAKSGNEVQLLTRQYDQTTSAIMDAEEKRLVICGYLAQELSLGTAHPTIAQIAARFNANQRAALLGLRDQLKGFIDRLAKINMSNQILLEESLFEIGRTFNIFVRSRAKFAGYRHTGYRDEKSVERNIINRIA